MTHWCRDISRDEAVRAAEDGREGPLPTLEECIERQKHAAMTAGVKEGFVKADGEWKRLTDDELRQLLVIPKTGLASSAVEPENKGDGMATNGLRTERVEIDLPPSPEPSVARVTLEFSGRLRAAPSQWPWDLILSGACVVRSQPGESVRVVEEANFDDLAQVAMERDAAIRERDAAKSDAEKSAVLIKSQAENVAYFRRDRDETRLRAEAAEARVAELESERDAAIRERDEFRRSFHWSEEAGTRLVAERDASRDDADGLRILVAELEAERDGLQVDVSALMDVGHRLGSQVASLELQLESVACRAATAETALESAPPPASGWLTEEERDFLDHHRRECEGRASTFSEARAVPWCRRLKMIDALLARSTPPEVVRPGTQVRYHRLSVEEQRDDQWLAALAAAGVTVEAKQ